MFLLTDAFQYFGPKLAMYIARLEFYTTYSSYPPALFFVVGHFRDTPTSYCILSLLVSVATSVFVDMWRRQHRHVVDASAGTTLLHLCGPISKESYELRCRVDLRQHRTDYRLVLHIDTAWSACCFLHQILLVPSVAMSSWPPRERLNVIWCDFCCCCCCN